MDPVSLLEESQEVVVFQSDSKETSTQKNGTLKAVIPTTDKAMTKFSPQIEERKEEQMQVFNDPNRLSDFHVKAENGISIKTNNLASNIERDSPGPKRETLTSSIEKKNVEDSGSMEEQMFSDENSDSSGDILPNPADIKRMAPYDQRKDPNAPSPTDNAKKLNIMYEELEDSGSEGSSPLANEEINRLASIIEEEEEATEYQRSRSRTKSGSLSPVPFANKSGTNDHILKQDQEFTPEMKTDGPTEELIPQLKAIKSNEEERNSKISIENNGFNSKKEENKIQKEKEQRKPKQEDKPKQFRLNQKRDDRPYHANFRPKSVSKVRKSEETKKRGKSEKKIPKNPESKISKLKSTKIDTIENVNFVIDPPILSTSPPDTAETPKKPLKLEQSVKLDEPIVEPVQKVTENERKMRSPGGRIGRRGESDRNLSISWHGPKHLKMVYMIITELGHEKFISFPDFLRFYLIVTEIGNNKKLSSVINFSKIFEKYLKSIGKPGGNIPHFLWAFLNPDRKEYVKKKTLRDVIKA